MTTNSKSSLFLSLFLLSIDKIPYMICTSLNDSILISECHVFGKADNQTDCTGHRHLMTIAGKNIKKVWEKHFPYSCLQKMCRNLRAKWKSNIISLTFSAIIHYSCSCDYENITHLVNSVWSLGPWSFDNLLTYPTSFLGKTIWEWVLHKAPGISYVQANILSFKFCQKCSFN